MLRECLICGQMFDAYRTEYNFCPRCFRESQSKNGICSNIFWSYYFKPKVASSTASPKDDVDFILKD